MELRNEKQSSSKDHERGYYPRLKITESNRDRAACERGCIPREHNRLPGK